MTYRGVSRTVLYRIFTAALFTSWTVGASAQIVLPADVKPTCTVAPVEIASWFESKTVTANGRGKPANSLTFPDKPNCSFFKWSWQMFLWLTSPPPPSYGGGTHVFNSPVFYDVSRADQNNQRTIIPSSPGILRGILSDIPQRGPGLRPVVFDHSGKMFNLVEPNRAPDGRAVLFDRANRPIEIERAEITPEGKAAFLGRGGRMIDAQTLRRGEVRVRDRSGKRLNLRDVRLVLNGRAFAVLSPTTAMEFEQAQAGNHTALLAQNNSLVLYGMHVNDVFAYLRTGQQKQTGGLNPKPTRFPYHPRRLTADHRFRAL